MRQNKRGSARMDSRIGKRILAWFLLVAAFGLAVLGQEYFLHRRDFLWDGLAFFVAAAACFLLAWRVGGAARAPRPERAALTWLPALRAHAVQALLLAVGLFLALVATLLSAGRALDAGTWDAVLTWVLGMVAVATAAVWPGRPAAITALAATPVPTLPPLSADHADGATAPSGLGRTLGVRLGRVSRAQWLETGTVAGLTLLALALRVAALERIPFTVGGDEAWHGLLARQVLHGELRNPFNMGYMSMPTGFYWPLSWAMWLVGDGVVGLRLPAALVGTATVPLLYLFARDLWGKKTALVAAAFLAGYDYHLHYSRLGANNVWDPLFVLVVMWAVARGLAAERDRTAQKWFLAGGLVMGLSVYFYTGARLLPLLVGAYAGLVWLRGLFGAADAPRGRRIGIGLLLLLLAFLVAAAPMLSYAASHPAEWNSRINQVGILQSGWLEREPGLTGKTTAAILAEQFLRAAGAFHVFSDRTVWYGADRPLLGFLPGILGLLGMVWAATCWRQPRYFLLLTWFWSVIIAGGMLTESPPSSQRLVMTIPAVAVLVAVGLVQTVRLARRLLAIHWRWADVALALVTVALVAGSIRFYFVEFTPERRYGSMNGETATMIGQYLAEVDRDYQVYLLGAPDIYWSFGTMPFLAPQVVGRDLVEPLTGPPVGVDTSSDALFVLLSPRAAELQHLQDAYPSGTAQEFYDEQGRLRFIAYTVDF